MPVGGISVAGLIVARYLANPRTAPSRLASVMGCAPSDSWAQAIAISMVIVCAPAASRKTTNWGSSSPGRLSLKPNARRSRR
jgi:hypothetical protein